MPENELSIFYYTYFALATIKDYPPRQKAARFSLDQVMEKIQAPGAH
jgi:hypothetical protein